MVEFEENFRISGEIICKTGLHVGGSADTLESGVLIAQSFLTLSLIHISEPTRPY